ncbi:disease resistance protein RPV1-like [Rhododendron vialii]|uniref:disease resistance protein RPV1-like n=1 Tax=Rhododendron vialii TaxID=182163 RepID=UPI00265E06A2|nr:disease resistance protein RPV1-like [Rhododendron vialii]
MHGSSSFLADVHEAAGKPNGLVSLQKQLISNIFKGRKAKIGDLICRKRVLVVLDDVDDMDQLNAFGIMRDWFHPGSKIMITTRSLHAFEKKYPKEGYFGALRKGCTYTIVMGVL